MEIVTAKSRYTSLETNRSPSLHRAREAAALTIPSLFPPEGTTDATKLPRPNQSIGARGVNNLSSKFLLTLLPPNEPFFKLMIDEFTLEELGEDTSLKAKVEEALGKIERAVMNEFEAVAARPVLSEALKQLLIAGNVLLFMQKGVFRMFRLDKYVVKRDPAGSVIEIVVKEVVSPNALPEGIQIKDIGVTEGTDVKTVDIYTHIKRTTEGKWEVYQEVLGNIIESSRGTYPLGACPWLPLRFIRVDGEDYGRGYVEEYIGDLIAVDGLQKAIVEGAISAAKLLVFVDPNGLTDIKTVTKAPNGAIRSGRAVDVTMLQSQKAGDFRVALETMNEITQRLALAFLMNSAIQRAGERVTAEEIRYMAGELEDALGGTYSILGQELQQPLVAITMHDLTKRRKIPSLPKGTVSPSITTGLDALGRGHDLTKLDTFLGGAQQIFGPEVITQRVNISDYLTRRATALGIAPKGLVYTEEEIEAKQQAEQEAAQQQMLLQQGLQTGGKMLEGSMKEMPNGDPQ